MIIPPLLSGVASFQTLPGRQTRTTTKTSSWAKLYDDDDDGEKYDHDYDDDNDDIHDDTNEVIKLVLQQKHQLVQS